MNDYLPFLRRLSERSRSPVIQSLYRLWRTPSEFSEYLRVLSSLVSHFFTYCTLFLAQTRHWIANIERWTPGLELYDETFTLASCNLRWLRFKLCISPDWTTLRYLPVSQPSHLLTSFVVGMTYAVHMVPVYRNILDKYCLCYVFFRVLRYLVWRTLGSWIYHDTLGRILLARNLLQLDSVQYVQHSPRHCIGIPLYECCIQRLRCLCQYRCNQTLTVTTEPHVNEKQYSLNIITSYITVLSGHLRSLSSSNFRTMFIC